MKHGSLGCKVCLIEGVQNCLDNQASKGPIQLEFAVGQDHRDDQRGPFQTCESMNRERTEAVTESERQEISSKTSELTADTP